ncbi:ribonuclease P protein subunit p30-like [Patiria miniata]|uniref:Ribonuclease P protein subunit p30 n=1 Tax=Patiria miniata TaxID=46514 RepID=A0A913Z278_PATMI|nr:ribonuclease P protein subunit p30-like [Patiria miniata]
MHVHRTTTTVPVFQYINNNREFGKMDTCDLHLLGNSDENALKLSLQCAARLGYGVVAIGYNCPVQEKQGGDKNKVKLPNAPAAVKLDGQTKAAVGVQSKGFKQLSRVNMVLSEGSETHKLRQDNIQSYDLLAVQPTTEKMFHMACTKLEIDIVCVDMTEKLPFYFKRVAINAAIERGLYFEIPYAPAIRDSTMRKNVLSNAMALITLCRGKNVIITSQATKPLEIRGPHDVANLGLLFGLSEQEAKNAVSTNCRAVLYHAATRRNTIKSVMSLQQIGDLSGKDRWKVKAGQEACGMSIQEGGDPTEDEGSGVVAQSLEGSEGRAKTSKRRKSKSKRNSVDEQSAMKRTRQDSAGVD